MVGKMINKLKYIEALQLIDYPIPQHYIRFFEGDLIFERIYLLKNGGHLKRKYFTITCPTTCEELKTFVKKIPLLLDWKQTIIMQTKHMIDRDE
ncbi:hypothetical protein BDC45DRAFT_486143 [Circinella umbellata]|nr:hypothetical protein BDC45DRAFT_486143 [Circinella umbellata]